MRYLMLLRSTPPASPPPPELMGAIASMTTGGRHRPSPKLRGLVVLDVRPLACDPLLERAHGSPEPVDPDRTIHGGNRAAQCRAFDREQRRGATRHPR